MNLESTTFWLIVFYIFVGCAIAFVFLAYRLLNRSKFRAESGEAIGVGYEEDATGHVLSSEPATNICEGDTVQPPHIAINK